MSNFSAEEVRAVAAAFARVFNESVSSMLTAYAERIEADERAVTDEVVQKAVQAFATSLLQQRDEGGRAHHKDMRAALLAVWPNPPAQAAQIPELRIGAPAWPGQREGKAPPEGWVQLSVNNLADLATHSPDAADSARVADEARVADALRVFHQAYAVARMGSPRRAGATFAAVRAVLQHALAAQPQSAASPVGVPDGWQLVPREPTDAMLNTFMTKSEARNPADTGYAASKRWAATLASAPPIDAPDSKR